MTFEELVAFCGADGRVAPAPHAWKRLWDVLSARGDLDAIELPSGPLILEGWWASDDETKRRRLLEHLCWAREHAVLEDVERLLVGLSDMEWQGSGSGRIGRW